MQANLPMGGYLINNLGTPAASTDASTKGYTDTQDTATQAAAVSLASPSGMVAPFAMNAAPTGWLACDGSAVSRTTYATLFSKISTTWGAGDGSTTFNLPDLRGYFLRGVGTNGDGTAAGAFATKVADAYLNHNHAITDPTHTHSGTFLTGASSTVGVAAGANYSIPATFSSGSIGAASTGISVNTSTTGSTETRPKNVAVLYCIKT